MGFRIQTSIKIITDNGQLSEEFTMDKIKLGVAMVEATSTWMADEFGNQQKTRNKIQAIKALRSALKYAGQGDGLRECKVFVEFVIDNLDGLRKVIDQNYALNN